MKRGLGKGLLVLAVLLLVGFPLVVPDPTITSLAVFTLLFAAMATAWNLFSGFTGAISLGHAAFFGIGAYTLALLCQDWGIPGGLTPLLLLPLAGVVAALVALPVGWLVLRTEGQTFVVLTIAWFYIIQLLAYNLRSLTNGATGISLPVPPWSGDMYNEPFYYAALILLLLVVVVAWWLRSSLYGLRLLAIRDDEERASGLGINTRAYKLGAFVLSAWFVGVGGGIWAYFVGALYPAFAFDPTVNTAFALMSFLGGIGTLAGPLLGALLFTPVQQYLTLQFGADGVSLLLEGGLFLCLLWLLPHGLLPSLQHRLLYMMKGKDK